MAKFDIILPIYNVQQYLKRCIDSILVQKYRDYKIILVDDGSKDNSPQICDEYAQKYPFIEVFHKENGGLSSARNAGLAKCDGEYVFFIDSDDWIREDTLQILADRIEKYPSDIVKFNYYRHVDGKLDIISSTAIPGQHIEQNNTEKLMLEALDNVGAFRFTAWSHIYKVEFLKKNKIEFVSEREIGSEDFLFNYEAYAMAQSVDVLEEALYYYDLRGGSLSQKYIPNLAEKYGKLYGSLKKFLKKNNLQTKYADAIDASYGWNYIRIIIPHEYREMPGHDTAEAHQNMRRILKRTDLQCAIRQVWRGECSIKQRVIILCIMCRLESVLYWIYTRRKKK